MYRTWCLAALMLIALPASADPQDLYRAGLRSFEFGYWREALVFFEAAAAEEPLEGASVREYGMWRAPYLPHFHQGAALFRLGKYAQALEALAESESQGAIRRRKARKYYRRLLELREEIRQAIEREVGEVHRGAAIDYETFEALRKSPVLTHPQMVEAVPEIGEIDRILESATSSLKNASLISAASDLQQAMSLLDEAREGIVTVAREVRKREIEIEEEKRRAALQARQERARADVEEASELIAGGGCQPRAVELLENVEHYAGADLFEAEGLAAKDLDLLLGQAHLACGHLALSREYLRRVAERAKGDRMRSLGRAITERRQRAIDTRGEVSRDLVAALSDYLLAAALAGEEDCQEPEISRLIERARGVLEDDGGPRTSALTSLPFSYTPHVVMAHAHKNCRARRDVEASLARAREQGRAPAARLAELEAWLAQNPRLEPYSGSYALLVGAYDYNLASGWPALYKPGEDVREVRRALEAHGFQVQTLVNPTSEQLESSLADFFAVYGQERSHRLVFYYAGHGYTESTAHNVKLGYIVPVDAGDPRQDRGSLKRLLSMERFREHARLANANDLLFMFDSCFAGTVFDATKSCVPPDCVTPSTEALTLTEQVSHPVRMFLTAGSEDQMVPDESVFRRMVTRALEGEADRDNDGFVLGRELGSFVQNMTLFERRTASTTRKASPLQALIRQEPAEPQWGTLREGSFGLGDILFHTPERARSPSPSVSERRGEIYTQLAYWAAAMSGLESGDLRRYSERFPEGYFAPLAGWVLERSDSASP